MRKNLLFLFIFCSAYPLNCISQQITFEKSYSHSVYQLTGEQVFQKTDGSYLLLLHADTVGNFDRGCITEIDSFGNVLWSKVYIELSNRMFFRDIEAVENNSFIISGIGGSTNSYRQILIKIDSLGNIIWGNCYGGSFINQNAAMAVKLLSDGNYLLVGRSYDFGAGDGDIYLLKTDTSGNTLWSRTLGTSDNECGMDAEITGSGNIMVMSGTLPGTSLAEFDNNGNLIWAKTYDLDHSLGMTQWAMKKCPDNGFAIVGVWDSDTSNVFWPYMFKTDSSGNVLWCKLYVGPAIVGEFFDLRVTSDSGFIITWEPEYPCQYCRTGLIKTDSYGNIEWSKNYVLNNFTFPSSSIQTWDEGYAEIGYGGFPYNTILIKTNGNGEVGCYDTTLSVNPINIAVTTNSFGVLDSGYIINPFNPFATSISLIQSDICMIQNAVSLFTSSNFQVCPGSCIAFFNLSNYSSSYQWSFPGAIPDTSTSTNPTNICYANPGSYDVQLIATNANGSDTLLLQNYITVFPTPLAQSITQSGDTLFAITGASSYQWYFNTNIINGATDYFYVAQTSGDYNVVCTDSNGCEVEAAVFNVIAGLTLTISKGEEINLYPNPVSNKLIIQTLPQLRPPATSGPAIEISIYNMLGFLAIQLQTSIPIVIGIKPETSVDVHKLRPGIYILEVLINNKKYHAKFVKE